MHPVIKSSQLHFTMSQSYSRKAFLNYLLTTSARHDIMQPQQAHERKKKLAQYALGDSHFAIHSRKSHMFEQSVTSNQ
jgi:hypothetical protein